MAKVFVLFMLLSSASLFAQETKPNPDDYTVNVHVRTSRLDISCDSTAGGGSSCGFVQRLKVTIDGKKYELIGGFGFLNRGISVLRPGDYKARITKDDTSRTYEYVRDYEFLFPDGHKRKYMVDGESE